MTNKEAATILIDYFKPPIVRNDGKSVAHLLALEAIAKAVDALEVTELVRCKDCKYFKTYPPTGDQDYTIYDCERLVYCTDNAVGNLPEDFCSRGERKEKE